MIRPHPEVVAFLHRVEDTGIDDAHFLEALATVPGGGEARDAIASYLDKYGMRCVGEIDITRLDGANTPPRSSRPSSATSRTSNRAPPADVSMTACARRSKRKTRYSSGFALCRTGSVRRARSKR